MSRFGRSSARASLLALALLSFATSCAGASGWRAAEHKLREQGLLHDVSPGSVTFRADAPGDDAPPPDPLPPAEGAFRALSLDSPAAGPMARRESPNAEQAESARAEPMRRASETP